MTRVHFAAALLAFGSLAALPACTTNTPSRTYSAAPATSPELSPGMVRQVQTALQQQGLYNGAIDGIWGPQTQSAVRSFQQSHALTPTGQLGSSTLAALNLPTAAPLRQPPIRQPRTTRHRRCSPPRLRRPLPLVPRPPPRSRHRRRARRRAQTQALLPRPRKPRQLASPADPGGVSRNRPRW